MSPEAGADLLDSAAAGPAAVRGGALRVAGFFAGSIVNLVAIALLLRHIGVDDGGRYVTVLSLVALAGGVTDAGLTSIATREFAVLAGPERIQMLRDLLGIRIALTTAGVAGAIVFAIAAGYSPTLLAGTAIAGGAILFQALTSAVGVGLLANLRFGWVALADVLRQVVAGLAVIVLVVAGAKLLPFFGANLLANVVALAVTAAVVRGAVPLRPTFDRRRWRALLRDTLPFAAATAVAAVYFRLAIVLVSLITSAAQTGYFGASFRAVEVLIAVPQLLVGAAFPIFARAARDDRARLSYAVGKVFDASVVLGLGIAVVLGVGATAVIQVVAGSDFAPAADVLRIHGLSLVATFSSAGWAYAALSLRLHRQILGASLVALATIAVLVPVLADAHGAVGAAVATAIGEVVLAIGLAVIVRRAGVSLSPDLRALRRVLPAAAAAAAAGVASGLPSAAAATAAIAVYAILLLVLKALPRELLDLLPRSPGRAAG